METSNRESGSLSLLLVEDDAEACTLVARALSMKFRQIRLLTAENGALGLELYQEHRPDIVLTDIKMPVMDGITMAGKIRELHDHAVICVLSAYCDAQEYRKQAEGLDVCHFLPKPVDYSTLFAAIDDCIATVAKRWS
ncbi:hypothetical protein GMLC_09620 [Geomonas limicola]|uniref:Response regulatory domain-containing protein n=1 Tax=Geomonas limicola TaxID=2740186 RepID=A0A6V8N761_9BACT|nr:response regulator [Geomonas limicola]GFO67383.1 hypothetical protein GMLC_09620 [Geomonas limicola]